MKKGHASLVLVFLGFLVFLGESIIFSTTGAMAQGVTNALQQGSEQLSISISPRIAHPGQAVMVTARIGEDCQPGSKGGRPSAWILAEGMKVEMNLLEHGTYAGFLPISLDHETGPLEIEVQLQGDGGTPILGKVSMKIEPKEYRKEYLKVKEKMVQFSKETLQRVLSDQKAVRHAASGLEQVPYWTLPFIWPVAPKVTSPFGLRRYFNGKPRSPHSGVDLKASVGDPVLAPNNGRVTLVRNCYLSGNTVVVDHGSGIATIYAHLSKVLVREGQMVEKGQTIGLAGATGRITGPHLHWSVSILGRRVDPVEFMKIAGRGAKGTKLNVTADGSEKYIRNGAITYGPTSKGHAGIFMDLKGIELNLLNLPGPSATAKDIRKESSSIRPVTKMEKAELSSRNLKGKDEKAQVPEGELATEQARTAADMLADFLSDYPELETGWSFDKDRGILVVEIRDKVTGEVLRQIPPEEILSGRVLAGEGTSGNLINTKA